MYYLWLNEAQAGPYALEQVQSMRNAGQITAETLYWQEGNAEWQPLGNMLIEVEPKKKSSPMPARTAVIRPFEQTIVRKTGNVTGASPAPQIVQQPAPVQTAPEKAQEKAPSTLWKWVGLVLVGLIVIALIGVAIAWLH